LLTTVFITIENGRYNKAINYFIVTYELFHGRKATS